MEQIRIDLVPGGVTPNAHASQYDVGRGIRFLLYNGGSAYTLAGTETITVDVTKPDGTTDTVSVTNTSSNYVDFVTTDGLLNQAGLYPCEISIVNGTDVIGSQNFNLRAEADAYDGADIVTVTVGPADICTFTTTLAEPLQSVTVDITATGGNGTPDSPIPINGYTEANITRCGVNFFDESTVYSALEDSGKYHVKQGSTSVNNIKFYMPSVLVGQELTFSAKLKGLNGANYRVSANVAGTNKNGNLVNTADYSLSQVTFTPTSTADFIIVDYSTGVDTGGVGMFKDCQLEVASAATNYHAYTGNTYTIAFGQTVYGGVLDVTRGKLTVTWGSVDLGSLSYEYDTTTLSIPIFYANISDRKQGDLYGLSDIYTCLIGARTLLESNNYAITRWNNSSGAIVIRNDDYTDKNAFKTAMSGHTLVYELATPFDIDLTPEVISAFVGTNNVFAGCGETTVKYLKAGA